MTPQMKMLWRVIAKPEVISLGVSRRLGTKFAEIIFPNARIQKERMIGRWLGERADDSVLDFSDFFPGGVIKKLAEPLTK